MSYISVSCLLLGPTNAAYEFANILLAFLLCEVALATFVAFVIQELRIKNPLVNLNLFHIPEFATGTLSMFLNSVTWGAML